MDWVDEQVDHSEPPLLRDKPPFKSVLVQTACDLHAFHLLTGPDIISELPGTKNPFNNPSGAQGRVSWNLPCFVIIYLSFLFYCVSTTAVSNQIPRQSLINQDNHLEITPIPQPPSLPHSFWKQQEDRASKKGADLLSGAAWGLLELPLRALQWGVDEGWVRW